MLGRGLRRPGRGVGVGGRCCGPSGRRVRLTDFGLYWPPTLAAIDQWLDDHDVDLATPAGTDTDAHRNAADFWSYFNVADELDGGLTLDDLDGTYVTEARRAADLYRLAWSPALADAEDFALAHRTALDAAMRG